MRRNRFSIPVVMALLAGTLFLGAQAPAGAAEYGPFTLTDISQTASWSGELQTGPPVPPEACVPDVGVDPVCDVVKVNVELPEDVWGDRTTDPVTSEVTYDKPGGMLIATQPPPDWTNVNDFGLYVYGPDGEPLPTRAAQADSAWSAGDHAVWVENPANGLYTVVVAPIVWLDPPASYDGFVSFDRGLTVKRKELRDGTEYTQTFVAFGLASPKPAVELVPDLVPTTPSNFHIETASCVGFYACPTEPAHQPSCYPEETAGLTSVPPQPGVGPTKCLRFDQGDYNVGDGPLELHIYPDQGIGAPDGGIVTDVYQRVYRSDGSVSQQPAGLAIFHPSHGHFHYIGGGGRHREATLHERLPNGEPGRQVAETAAKGICLVDVVNGRFGQRPARNGPTVAPAGGSPQAYGNHDSPSGCTIAHQQDPNDDAAFPNSPYIQLGISVGWADVYPWSLIDQYIDITNVADGKYILVSKTDSGGRLREKSTANNTAMACVEISGLTARACPREPDLQVTSLSASNTKSVREGEKVTITATVANTGDGDAAASSTEILVDGMRLPGGLLSTPALNAGESATLSLNWDTRGVKGEHTITATADSGRTVEESIEDNNTRGITVVVRGNKIRNPSFEESSNGTSPDAWSSSGPTGYETGGSDGVRSVSTEPGGSWTSEAVPIDAGASYDASVAAAGAGGTLLVQQLTADGSVLSGAAQPLPPTGAFTITNLQLTALAGAAQARIVLLGGVTGTTSFDDVGLFSG